MPFQFLQDFQFCLESSRFPVASITVCFGVFGMARFWSDHHKMIMLCPRFRIFDSPKLSVSLIKAFENDSNLKTEKCGKKFTEESGQLFFARKVLRCQAFVNGWLSEYIIKEMGHSGTCQEWYNTVAISDPSLHSASGAYHNGHLAPVPPPSVCRGPYLGSDWSILVQSQCPFGTVSFGIHSKGKGVRWP